MLSVLQAPFLQTASVLDIELTALAVLVTTSLVVHLTLFDAVAVPAVPSAVIVRYLQFLLAVAVIQVLLVAIQSLLALNLTALHLVLTCHQYL